MKGVNKKIKVVIGTLLVILIIICGIIFYLKKKDNNNIQSIKQELGSKLNIQDMEYEYGDILYLENLKLDNNTTLYINNEELTESYKFLKIGEYKLKEIVEQNYCNFFKKEETIKAEKEVTITVIDTKKPIIDGVSDKQITEGDMIDLKQGITARDEVDGILDVIIEGEVDTNKAGEYDIKVKAIDINNNIAETSYKVTVKAKEKPVLDNTTIEKNEAKVNTGNSTSTKSNTKIEKNTQNKTPTKTENNTTSQSNKKQIETNKTEEQPKTSTGVTDGNKYYFQDRGEDGNYGEKFSW